MVQIEASSVLCKMNVIDWPTAVRPSDVEY